MYKFWISRLGFTNCRSVFAAVVGLTLGLTNYTYAMPSNEEPNAIIADSGVAYPANVLPRSEAQRGSPYVEGQIIVKMKTPLGLSGENGLSTRTASDRLAHLLNKFDLTNERKIRKASGVSGSIGLRRNISGATLPMAAVLDHLYVLDTQAQDIEALAIQLMAEADVEYAQPDYIMSSALTPNDPYFSTSGSWNPELQDLWGLHNINIADVWDTLTGEGVVVAVVDSGVSFSSVELSQNRYVSADIPNNGIDDDGNGYVDDSSGWNFVEDNNLPDDDHGHGTHVAGTIASVMNNSTGIVGVSPGVKILPIRALGSRGGGSTSDLVEALMYAVDNGADIINNSWGSTGRSFVLADMVTYALENGVLPIFSAGNIGIDTIFATPAGESGAITVAASTVANIPARFTNRGYELDIAAPGQEILSLNVSGSFIEQQRPDNVVDGDYLQINGTSMSAPHISGVAALLLQEDPNLSPDQIRSIMRATATPWAVNNTRPSGPGIVNALAAVQYLRDGNVGADTRAFIQRPISLSLVNNTSFQMKGTATGPAFSRYDIDIAKKPTDGTTQPIFETVVSNNVAVNSGVLGEISTSTLEPGLYTARLRAYSTNGAFNVHQIDFTVDAHLENGWPKFNERLHQPGSMPGGVMADLDNDGVQEIIIADLNNLYVYDAHGAVKPGYPRVLPASPQYALTVADLDGDGDLEIAYPSQVNNSSKYIYAFEHTGELVNGFPAGVDLAIGSDYVTGSGRELIAADINGNGKKELIGIYSNSISDVSGSLTYQTYLTAVDHNGAVLPGYNVFLGDQFNFRSNTIAADIDRDGRGEIIATVSRGDNNVSVEIYDGLGQKRTSSRLLSTFDVFDTIAFRASNGNVMYVAGGVSLPEDISSRRLSVSLYEIDKDSLSIGRIWTRAIPNNNFVRNMIVHDVDQDGSFEILLQPGANQFPHVEPDLFVYKLDGTLTQGIDIDGSTVIFNDITVSQLSEHPAGALVSSNGLGSVIVTDLLGNSIGHSPYHVPGFQNADLMAGDVDGDGLGEIIANNFGGNVYTWEIASMPETQPFWHTRQRNIVRTNFMDVEIDKTFPSMLLRSDVIEWNGIEMTLVADFTWQAQIALNQNSEFKFDVDGSWAFNFGDNENDGVADPNGDNIPVNGSAGDYLITFNDKTLEYTKERVNVLTVDVFFQCLNGQTNPGESVYVVGNIPELGNWSIASNMQKLDLVNAVDWSRNIVGIEGNQTVEWKCVKADDATSAIVEWQGGNNNSFSLTRFNLSVSASF